MKKTKTTATKTKTKTLQAPKVPATNAARLDPGVTDFLRALKHPLKKEIETLRHVMLGLSPAVGEGVKWNAPSYRATDYFATVNLRSVDRVQLVFHRGAKVKDNTTDGLEIADPAGLIKWLAKERCLVTLGAGAEFEANRAPFAAIVRAWLRQL